MGTEILTSFGNLQHELEEAKNSLKGVDESIKRLIGRDPSELPPRNIVKRPVEDKTRTITKATGRTRLFTENEEPPIKRRGNVSVFKRLSAKVPDDDPPVPYRGGLISKVIVTPKEVPSRERALEAQNKDEQFRARNKRMFGALLGTLQKFQQEETKLKQREQKRAELEKKIEEHEIKEKEEVRKERQELFFNRKKKQAEIKVIELKMLRMKEYASWEQSQKPRASFIQTKAKPHINYLPRKMSDSTRKLLEESSKEIHQIIDKKKKHIAEELENMEYKMKKSFDYKFGAQKEGKEETHIEQGRSGNHRENDQNEDDQNDQNEDHNEDQNEHKNERQNEHLNEHLNEHQNEHQNNHQNEHQNENQNDYDHNKDDHIEDRQNDDNHIDGDEIDNSLTTNNEEYEHQVQPQLDIELSSIQLPASMEINGEENVPQFEINSGVIPDPQNSFYMSEYYLETEKNATNIQVDNYEPQTGE